MTADLRELLSTTLSGYTIERELGGGGMSRVFLAEETELGRRVVVKVLSPDLAQELSAERFAREIRVSAQLQHPNIVPVLAAGAAGGISYYTMPYVDGESLRARLLRLPHGERLALPLAISVLRDVARALAYAHARGVVHRDIKPDNVLLSDDAVVVADFGIAKALDAARTSATAGATLTQIGTVLGTPAYMAPEQAAGDPDTDHRADLYAWGVLAYEVLAGRHPFADKRTTHALIAAHMAEQPAPLATAAPELEFWLVSLVTRCLAKDPADRPTGARELVDALATDTPSGMRVTPPAEVAMPSVGVLPFANLSGSADDEYFSDGMTEEVINALAQLPTIRVAGRTSAFALKGQRLDLRTIGQQLCVQSILEGSVRRAGNRVRISVQLVGAADGVNLWSDKFDRELADVFALQDEIAQAITKALDQRLGGATAAKPEQSGVAIDRGARAAVDPAAYDLFLRGRFLFEQHAGLDAIACFERVMTMVPSFAPAYAWFAMANMLSSNLNLIPALTGYPRGRAAADRALDLDPKLPEALLACGAAALWFDRDQDRAEQLFRDVVVLAPSWSHGHEFIAWSALAAGRFDDMTRTMDHAMELDPLSDFMLYNYVIMLFMAGRAQRALDLMQPALARASGKSGVNLLHGTVLFAADRLQDARATLERALEVTPTASQWQGTLVCVRAAMGDVEAARQRLVELQKQAEQGNQSAIEVACGFQAVGDDESAFAWLERAFDARGFLLTSLHLDPRFRRLWGTPRFEALIKRIGIRGSHQLRP